MKMLEEFAVRTQKQLNKVSRVLASPLPFGLVPMRNIIPVGESGSSRVEHFEITERDMLFHNLTEAINGRPAMGITMGKYVRLVVNGQVMMSDTPHEARSSGEAIRKARGSVLIAGFGLGMILVPILKNPKVTRVVVVEKNPDVLQLCYMPFTYGNHLTDEEKMKLIMVPADIFEYTAAKNNYDVIFFDIWPTISLNSLPDIKKLKSRFQTSLKKGGWMGAWVEKEINQMKRRDAQLRKQIAAELESRHAKNK
jgi:spermidine synthase